VSYSANTVIEMVTSYIIRNSIKRRVEGEEDRAYQIGWNE
jgi:hypothetical protein